MATATTSTSFTDLIGDSVEVVATVPGGRSIQSATWSVQGGTIGSQTMGARAGITNTPLNIPDNTTTTAFTSTLTLNWDQTTGAQHHLGDPHLRARVWGRE